MKVKDKKAFIIYVLLTSLLWQLCISISKVLKGPFIQLDEKIFSIVSTTNDGAAFGAFNDNPYILGSLGAIVLIAVLFYVYKKVQFEEKVKILSLSFFSAGILGNTIERFQNGYVVDFIKINLFDFPVFNLFDVLICLSVFIYIVWCLREEFQKRAKK